MRAGRRERNPHRRITGILDSNDRLARNHERPGDEVERLLRARRDDYVIGRAGDCAGEADMLGDRPAELAISLVALGASRRCGAGLQPPQLTGHHLPEGRVRE